MTEALLERVQQALPALAEAGAAGRAPLAWGRLQALLQRWPQAPARVQAHLASHLTRALAAVQTQLAQPAPASGLPPVAARPSTLWPPHRPAPAGLRHAPALQQQLTRLRLAQQLQQVLAAAPSGAGPLHAQVLVQRSLAGMQALSPAYLRHFMQHLDALQALEDGQRRPTAPKAKAAAARAAKA